MTSDWNAQLAEMRRALKATSQHRFSPLPSPIDELIGGMLVQLREASEADRQQFIDSMVESDAYALLAHAERMSMLSVRRDSEDLLVQGLAALAYATTRVDPRMALMILSLLHHSAVALKKDPAAVFARVGEYLADPAALHFLNQFLQREPRDKSISAMGFQQIKGPSGVIYWQGTADSVPEGFK